MTMFIGYKFQIFVGDLPTWLSDDSRCWTFIYLADCERKQQQTWVCHGANLCSKTTVHSGRSTCHGRNLCFKHIQWKIYLKKWIWLLQPCFAYQNWISPIFQGSEGISIAFLQPFQVMLIPLKNGNIPSSRTNQQLSPQLGHQFMKFCWE